MTIHQKMTDLLSKRTKAFDAMKSLAEKEDFSNDTDGPAFEAAKKAVADVDDEITRHKAVQELAAKTAQPASGQEKVPAAVETDPYVQTKSLLLGGVAKMIGKGYGNIYTAREAAKETYGESHPVTKALLTSIGASGGFIVPPDVMNEIIPLLRAETVVRAAGPKNIPMPRGTMTLPAQASAASASYGSETKAISASQPSFGQIVASYKKLTALVPIGNDMMRYADPAIDAIVRDDLVQVIALREDLAFILGDGTQDTPRGYLSFANGWVSKNSGTVGVFSTTAASTLAVNGTDPANSTGGNFITSNASYTQATVGQELLGAINKLDLANVPNKKRMWFMNPRTFNYLFGLQNSLGLYVYRDELTKGTLLMTPFKVTTQIGTNYWDAAASNKDLSFIFLVEMTEDIILDSMQLELAVFREASFVDANGATISAAQSDLTLIRAITEHDHQMRHDAAVSVIQGVRWAPALT